MSSGENGRLAGRYRIVRQLGRGGMGVVWRAVDEVLGREVAVKELRTYSDAAAPELADLRLRMTREARAAARVRHPGVVAVHDVTEHEGRPVIVMELVDGPSLDDVLAERGTVDPAEAARIGAHVLEALAAAHDVGVLHRDVKPGNILLDRSGRIVLTDFGIATMEDPGDGSATHLTRSGEIVGSLDFLAPERAQGQDPGPASDVWAVGATLYAAVEGSSPFRRTSTWSTLAAIVTEPLPEPRRSGPLIPVLLRLLDKDPASRPTAREAARLLGAVGGAAPGPEAAGPNAGEQAGPATVAPHQVAPHQVAPHQVAPHQVAPHQVASPPVASEPVAPAPEVPAPNPYAGSVEPNPYAASAEPHPYAPAAAPPAGAFGPAVPVPPAPSVRLDAGTGAPGGRAARRAEAKPRRGSVLVAAAVAAVLLAGGGVTYALMDHDGSTQAAGETPQDGDGGGAAGGDPGRVLDPGSSTAPSGRPSGGATPSTGPTPSGRESGAAAGGAPATDGPGSDGSDPGAAGGPAAGGAGSDAASGAGGGGGTKAPGTAGGSTTAGGTTTTHAPSGGGATTAPTTQAPPPASGCTASGSSATCQVVRSATTTRYDGGEMGTVGAGPHSFSCQVDLDRTETYGGASSRWFARTDDDSGNTNVYLSVLHLSGGGGGGPVAGLRIC
ncbi:serine/threonine protein kinase [Streptomyces nymphaeiformis]|uniref:non-specific serine/threonine protein kinase n=1 Tax=Streptomyces nymphaeiformis TaxID=2663842 RepID=A0A7W7XB97_9ACTN|nr:serine/threonine protein kinase [Streptomyces nymphaeiformis]MBB4981770.1 tRNA A-37 threonylcarbamoyl transferase component Bud32 [Streptomyces nymphaeiformis]